MSKKPEIKQRLTKVAEGPSQMSPRVSRAPIPDRTPLPASQDQQVGSDQIQSERDILAGIEQPPKEGIKVSAPDYAYKVTSDDLYPGMNRPLQQGRTAYGDPLFDGGNFIFPMGVVANRLQAASNQERMLQEQASSFDPYANIDDFEHPEYSKSFLSYTGRSLSDFIESSVGFMKGDRMKAMQALNNPNHPLGMAFRQRVNSINALGKSLGANIDDAHRVLQEAEDGLYHTPEALAMSENFLREMGPDGSGLTPEQAAELSLNFRGVVGADSWLNSLDYGKLAKLGDEETSANFERLDGRYSGTVSTTTKSYDDLVNSILSSAPRSVMQQVGPDYLRQQVMARLPQETETKQSNVKDRLSNTGSGGDDNGKVSFSAGPVTIEHGGRRVDYAGLTIQSAKPKELNIKDAKGDTFSGFADSVVFNGSEFVLIGRKKQLAKPGVVESAGADSAPRSLDQSFRVPLSQNRGLSQSLFGVDDFKKSFEFWLGEQGFGWTQFVNSSPEIQAGAMKEFAEL